MAMTTAELKIQLKQVVQIAAIATVRKVGGKALDDLDKDLGLEISDRRRAPLQGLVAGGLVSVVSLTMLWFGLPLLAAAVDYLNGPQDLTFWPEGVDALKIPEFICSHKPCQSGGYPDASRRGVAKTERCPKGYEHSRSN
ncbi:hypothetical protein HFN69_22080 [Rhizobium laguerreae]|uniref:hypothetical protein n=1 Tax=Rhizobium laguerreae TaxID=1076926 RepID=UPI001C91C8DE|nr:hypothetical protein [Rhizobium laguerreae]MBY3544809.1 hypothetical protein [Rhizobium laguerreae]MBY3549266.1 hypothetical protein [Rhizobium laguerreae]